MSCVVIAGTGTGGHVFPAIAVAQELKRQDKNIRIIFVHAGRKRFDDSAFGGLGEVVWVPGTGMPRGFSFKIAVFLIQTLRSLFRSLKIVKKYSPDAAVGFGNFGSYGILRAAAFRRVPVFLHEANSIPGKANRLLGKFAGCIGINFADACKWFAGKRVEIVGMPIREEFSISRNRDKAVKYFNLDGEKPVLLITGGSQGARHINNVVCELLPRLKEAGIQVVHLTGRDGYEDARLAHDAAGIKSCVKPFESEMKTAFDAADIIVSRSGASSLAEIAATGKPAILVPYPFATDNHQFYNAKYLSDRNAAMLILDEELTANVLLENIQNLMNSEAKRRELSSNCSKTFVKDSAHKIAEIIVKMCQKQEMQ